VQLEERLANLGLRVFNPRLASIINYLYNVAMVGKLRARKMASYAISRKGCKQNFIASEIAVLMEKVEENLSLIQSKFSNIVTNQKKMKCGKKIADALNAVGVAMRTTAKVCENWGNLHSQVENELVN